jgi:hypothetical protein
LSITVRRGATFAAIADGLPQGLVGTLTFGVRKLPEGTLVVPETTDAIVEYAQGDGTSNYEATRTMPADAIVGGRYETAWPSDLVAVQEDISVQSAAGPGLLSIDDLRAATDVTEAGDGNFDLEQIAAAVERFAARYTGRQLQPDPPLVNGLDTAPPVVKRIVVGRAHHHPGHHHHHANGVRFIRVPDAREVTAVTIDAAAVAAGGWELRLSSISETATHLELLSYAHGRVAEITGRFGFLEPPPDLYRAMLELAARRVYEQSAGLVDATQSSEWGGRQYVKRMPSPVREVFDSYRVGSDLLGLT